MSKYDDQSPIPVLFPLKGEWRVPNTPGKTIPSHGTDMFGQRFAYDFVKREDLELAEKYWTGVRYWLGGGISLDETIGRGEEILAPIAGKIIEAKDGWPERTKATPKDLWRAMTFPMHVSDEELKKDFRHVAGNYIVIEGKDASCFLAHLTPKSVIVKEGDEIEEGQVVGRVGHTGNSTMPHLHMHLMDNPDFWQADGLPTCFKEYEKLEENGKWHPQKNAIPGPKDIIRSTISVA